MNLRFLEACETKSAKNGNVLASPALVYRCKHLIILNCPQVSFKIRSQTKLRGVLRHLHSQGMW